MSGAAASALRSVRVFEARATQLYEEVVASGRHQGRRPADRRRRGAPRPPSTCWSRLNLLDARRATTSVWHAVDPATVQSQVVAPAGRSRAPSCSTESAAVGAGLLGRWRSRGGARRPPSAARSPSSAAPSDRRVHRPRPWPTPRRSCSPPSRRTGRDGASARRRRPSATWRPSSAGVKMRTLYQHSARRSSITHKYVAAVTARGRRGAHPRRVLQPDDRHRPAARDDPRRQRTRRPRWSIREPDLVAYLVDIFERTWERGPPVHQPRAAPLSATSPTSSAQMTIRMLIEGHADPASAKRLGRQPAHLRRLRRRPQGGVRGGDPLPARLHDGPARHLRQRARRRRTSRRREPRRITRAAPVALPSFMRPAGGVA